MRVTVRGRGHSGDGGIRAAGRLGREQVGHDPTTAALVLETSQSIRGGSALGAVDFQIAFLIIALFMALAAILHWRLAPTAGANVSRHQP